jgi:hypothetical protein
VPGPTGKPKPSCAALCTCPFGVKIQTFDIKRGPLIREYPWTLTRPWKRRMLLSQHEEPAEIAEAA